MDLKITIRDEDGIILDEIELYQDGSDAEATREIRKMIEAKFPDREKGFKKYNHAYTVAFSIDTDHEPDEVTVDELLEGMYRRVDQLAHCRQEVQESCGPPYDTYANGEAMGDDEFACDKCQMIRHDSEARQHGENKLCGKCFEELNK